MDLVRTNTTTTNKLKKSRSFRKVFDKLSGLVSDTATRRLQHHPSTTSDQVIYLSSITYTKQYIAAMNLMEAEASHVRDQLITVKEIDGLYGKVPYHYADWTASGLAIAGIEETIIREVLPTVSNVHSRDSHGGRITTILREQAREMVMRANGADERDACLFLGSGSTAAIIKMAEVLGLKSTTSRQGKESLRTSPEAPIVGKGPCVLLTPYEHHSNLLIWRIQTDATVIEIPLSTTDGSFSMRNLSICLKDAKDQGYSPIICSIAAASNVTGIYIDMADVSREVHKVGGIAMFDCAAYASHKKIVMNPPSRRSSDATIIPAEDMDCADAIFLSPHKLAGGPGCPGVLIAKRRLFVNEVPGAVGGGCVSQVTRNETFFYKDIETREEAGTPDIVGSIRCGLVFNMKTMGSESFRQGKIQAIVQHVTQAFDRHPAIRILGPDPLKVNRLPVFSIVIKGLAQSFVNRLLNDLFGIQARSGCFCSHIYHGDILDIPDFLRSELVDVSDKYHGYRPGSTRFNFAWFDSARHIEWIVRAVLFIAEHGWRYMPEYTVDVVTGGWTRIRSTESSSAIPNIFKVFPNTPPMQHDLSIDSNKHPIDINSHILNLLDKSNDVLRQAVRRGSLAFDRGEEWAKVPNELEHYRYFAMPSEVEALYRAVPTSRASNEQELWSLAQSSWLMLCSMIDNRMAYPLKKNPATTPTFNLTFNPLEPRISNTSQTSINTTTSSSSRPTLTPLAIPRVNDLLQPGSVKSDSHSTTRAGPGRSSLSQDGGDLDHMNEVNPHTGVTDPHRTAVDPLSHDDFLRSRDPQHQEHQPVPTSASTFGPTTPTYSSTNFHPQPASAFPQPSRPQPVHSHSHSPSTVMKSKSSLRANSRSNQLTGLGLSPSQALGPALFGGSLTNEDLSQVDTFRSQQRKFTFLSSEPLSPASMPHSPAMTPELGFIRKPGGGGGGNSWGASGKDIAGEQQYQRSRKNSSSAKSDKSGGGGEGLMRGLVKKLSRHNLRGGKSPSSAGGGGAGSKPVEIFQGEGEAGRRLLHA